MINIISNTSRSYAIKISNYINNNITISRRPLLDLSSLSNYLEDAALIAIIKIGIPLHLLIILSIIRSIFLGQYSIIILYNHIFGFMLGFLISYLLLLRNKSRIAIIFTIIQSMLSLILQIYFTKSPTLFAAIIPALPLPSIVLSAKKIISMMIIYTIVFCILSVNIVELQSQDWTSIIPITWAISITFFLIGNGIRGVLRDYIIATKKHELEAVQRARIEEQNRLLVEHNDRLLFAQHDLRGPCNSVLGAVEILQATDLDAPTQQHLLQQLEPATLQLRARIDALFDQAKTPLLANQQELPPIDLAQVVSAHLPELRRMTNLLAPNAGQPARVWATGERSVVIRGRLGELQRILENLVINAAGVGATEIQIETTQRDGQVALTISDNGPGFPAWLLAQPLRPMVSGRQHGTGLGLAGTVANVQAFAGALELRNTASGGLVDIRFPAAAGELGPSQPDATKLQPAS